MTVRRILSVLALVAAALVPWRVHAAWGTLLAKWTSSGASATSVRLQSSTSVQVLIQCDGDAYLQFGGASVVATADSPRYYSTAQPWLEDTKAGFEYLAALSVGAGPVTCRVWKREPGGALQ